MCISENKDLGLISDEYGRNEGQEKEEKKCDVMWKKWCMLIISFYMGGYQKILFYSWGWDMNVDSNMFLVC